MHIDLRRLKASAGTVMLITTLAACGGSSSTSNGGVATYAPPSISLPSTFAPPPTTAATNDVTVPQTWEATDGCLHRLVVQNGAVLADTATNLCRVADPDIAGFYEIFARGDAAHPIERLGGKDGYSYWQYFSPADVHPEFRKSFLSGAVEVVFSDGTTQDATTWLGAQSFDFGIALGLDEESVVSLAQQVYTAPIPTANVPAPVQQQAQAQQAAQVSATNQLQTEAQQEAQQTLAQIQADKQAALNQELNTEVAIHGQMDHVLSRPNCNTPDYYCPP